MRHLLLVPAALMLASPVACPAQTASSGVGAAAPAGAQCLSRPFQDANGASQTLTVYVMGDEAAAYAARGFAASACRAQSASAFRAEACRLSRLGNVAVQNRLTQVLGVRPADLCASATRVSPLVADTTG